MNVLKNFEAVFVVAVGVATCASYFAESADVAANSAPAFVNTAHAMSVATPSRMAVVTVVGKRMNALEKLRSLEDERRLAKSGAVNGTRS